MKKGTATKLAILHTALNLASQHGLNSLTIGSLAKAHNMSKSGLYAHFKSRERLQLELLQYTQLVFKKAVIKPILAITDPKERLHQLVHNWLHWHEELAGSCFYIGAIADFDDLSGNVADELKIQQNMWLDLLLRYAKKAQQAGYFKADLDMQQFCFELYSLYLGRHLYNWVRQEQSDSRFIRSFDILIKRYQS